LDVVLKNGEGLEALTLPLPLPLAALNWKVSFLPVLGGNDLLEGVATEVGEKTNGVDLLESLFVLPGASPPPLLLASGPVEKVNGLGGTLLFSVEGPLLAKGPVVKLNGFELLLAPVGLVGLAAPAGAAVDVVPRLNPNRAAASVGFPPDDVAANRGMGAGGLLASVLPIFPSRSLLAPWPSPPLEAQLFVSRAISSKGGIDESSSSSSPPLLSVSPEPFS